LPSVDKRPSLYAVDGGVLSLSGPALEEFLRDVLSRGVRFRFRARGMSMEPFIRDGDVVTVAPADRRLPGVGDVVASCHPRDGHLIVHRIIAVAASGIVLKGDANDFADGVIPPGGVLGRVVAVSRCGRRVGFGGGPERVAVASLSRHGLLRPLVEGVRRAVHRVCGPPTRNGGRTRGETHG
jgi:hypothetical protein